MTPNASFVYADLLTHYRAREDHPLQPRRLKLVHDLLTAYGVFDGRRGDLVAPRIATATEVGWCHDADYVTGVRDLSAGKVAMYEGNKFGFSSYGDNPAFPGIYEAHLWSTGASLAATELVLAGKVGTAAANFAGGLHHAMSRRTSGFCVFNDPAIAIELLLRQGKRVVYVDIDAHHGDGVQNAFYETDRVLTISLHESGQFLFPGTGSVDEMGTGAGLGYSVNVPLYPYTDDETYLWAFGEVVPPLIGAFKPDVLVTQLGIDTHADDPLTHLALTSEGYGDVVRKFAAMHLPWVAMGGGGYSLDAVARCWSLAFSIMAGIDLPDEIPDSYAREHGTLRLHDAGPARIPEAARPEMRRYAERSVHDVQKRIFPIHKIG